MSEDNDSRQFDELWIAFEDWRDSKDMTSASTGAALERFGSERQLENSAIERLRNYVRLEESLRGVSAGSVIDRENPSDRIGNFRLVKKIGSGGMGSVWLAEQESPVQRQVAIKLIRTGLDGEQFLARFDLERQSLAMMSHPNIAQIFEAGKTTSQMPYMVMEYVPGMPITGWCDQNRSSIQERLRLFLQVCSAVQHSHQKGILHRDLKPANLLVTTMDGHPAIKVIDFGLAKILGQSPNGPPGLTRNLVAVGTPLWMSPEQLAVGSQVDTRSDVFSLGCVLYELLTGETPLDPKSIELFDLNELATRVRNLSCQVPSERVRTSDQAEVWALRCAGLSRALLATGLQQDLDWIALKSLRAEPSDRYQGVNELAQDLQRHLEGDPVLARPDSLAYRLRKFVGRHKLVSGLALSIAFLVIGSAIVASVLAIWAVREQTAANESKSQLARALRDVQTLADEESRMIDSILRSFGSANPWRQGADRFRSLDDFYLAFSAEMDQWKPTSDRQIEKRLRTEIAQGFYGLGRKDLAAREWEKVLRLQEEFAGSPREVAWVKLDYAQALLGVGALVRARELIDSATPAIPADAELDLELALKYDLVNAELAGRTSDFQSMYDISGTALQVAKRHSGLEARSTRDLYTSLINACLNLRKFDEALAMATDAREFCDRTLGPDALVSLQFHCFQVIAKSHLHAPDFSRDEALDLLGRTQVKLGLSHPSSFFFRNGIAAALRESGHFSDALILNQQNLQLAEGMKLTQGLELEPFLVDLGVTLKAMGQFAESIPYWQRVLDLEASKGSPAEPLAIQAECEIADAYLRIQQPVNAHTHAKRAISYLGKNPSPNNSQLREFLFKLVSDSELAMRAAEAEK